MSISTELLLEQAERDATACIWCDAPDAPEVTCVYCGATSHCCGPGSPCSCDIGEDVCAACQIVIHLGE